MVSVMYGGSEPLVYMLIEVELNIMLMVGASWNEPHVEIYIYRVKYRTGIN